MYKQYNTNQLSLELNLAWDLPATVAYNRCETFRSQKEDSLI